MIGKSTDGDQKIPALAGKKWRSMSNKDKEKYKKLEAEAKKKHEAAMEEWKKKVSLIKDTSIIFICKSYGVIQFYEQKNSSQGVKKVSFKACPLIWASCT